MNDLQIKRRPKILISSGETSGDFYAASFIDVLQKYGDFDIYAIGGLQTKRRNVKMLCDSTNWAAIGLFEAIKQIPRLPLVFMIRRFLIEERPDVVILIDYPGFNMWLCHQAKKFGIPTVFNFPPSKFADSPDKVRDAARSISVVAANFQCTYDIYKQANANVEFVGHPLVDYAKPELTPEQTCAKYGLAPNRPIIALCPGSRKSELDEILPTMLGAAKIIHKKHPEYQFMVPVVATEGPEVFGVKKTELRKLLKDTGLPIVLAEGRIYDIMNAAKLLLICSGTATLEGAFVGTPMIICYKVSFFTELQARLFYKLPEFIGLPNIILKRQAAPELLQHDCTPEAIAEKSFQLLENKEVYEKQKTDFAEMAKQLGKPGSNNRVAEMVINIINQKNGQN